MFAKLVEAHEGTHPQVSVRVVEVIGDVINHISKFMGEIMLDDVECADAQLHSETMTKYFISNLHNLPTINLQYWTSTIVMLIN